jgi:asparagine synthase (glutamine-hydrolysing)
LLGPGTTVHDLMRADMGTWLVDDILTKADRMSMAASLELRVPYLDQQVVEFVAALPERWKQPVPVTKPLLRRALAPLLPPSVQRIRKHAFSVPVSDWLRGDLFTMATERLLPLPGEDHGLLHRGVVARLWREHQRGVHDHAPLLWTLLCFEVWYAEVFQKPEQHEPLAAGA